MTTVFVFGSNLAGRHGRGAALTALRYHGAILGQGEGRQGNSYAIPTKNRHLTTLPLEDIRNNVERFLDYARAWSAVTFKVTAIGCGLAGYTAKDIAPFFKDAPPNCDLPLSFMAVLNVHDTSRN